jgi:hypothetical protein
MKHLRGTVAIALASALVMSAAGAALGLSSASPAAHAAKKKHSNRGPRGPRGPRGFTAKGATGATGTTGSTGATGAVGISYVSIKAAAPTAAGSFTNVVKTDGLSIDIECQSAPGNQAIIYAGGPADSKAAMTFIDSFGATAPLSNSVQKFAPYTDPANPAGSGTQVAMADATHPATLTFSYSTAAGKVVTGTLSFFYGQPYQTGTDACYASGSVQSN